MSFTEYGLTSRFVLESPEPLVCDSDRDAEGVTDPEMDLLYVTPPMQGASPIVPDSTLLTMEESPAEDHLDEAGTLVPIQEMNEVEVEEMLMAPEENEEPIPMREQPPAYRQVCGQRAIRGWGQAQPFHCHLFPYTVNQDQRLSPGVGEWAFAPSKRRRSNESRGDEGRPSSKQRQIESLDCLDQPGQHCADPSSSHCQESSNDPGTGSGLLFDQRWGIGFHGSVGNCGSSVIT